MGGDAFPATEGAEPLVRRRLDADRGLGQGQRCSEATAHAGEVRGDLRLFGNKGGIHVGYAPTAVPRLRNGLFHYAQGRDPFDGGIRIGKVMTDIGESGRPENGIGNGVTENIGIRVTDKALCEGNFHPSKEEAAPFFKTVNIVTDARSGGGGGVFHGLFFKQGAQVGKVRRRGQLRIGKGVLDKEHLIAEGFHSGEIIRDLSAKGLMGAQEEISRKGLGRFHRPEVFAVEQLAAGWTNKRRLGKAAHRVRHAAGHADSARMGTQRSGHLLQGLFPDGRARTIMDPYPMAVLRERSESGPHGILAPLASLPESDRKRDRLLGEGLFKVPALPCPPVHNYQMRKKAAIEEGAKNMPEEALSRDLKKNLVLAYPAHAGSGSAGEE